MNVCPACGQPNDDNVKFCRECHTRLENFARARIDEKDPIFVPMPDTALRPRAAGLSLSTISLVLGIFGIGIPAIAFGAVAWRKEPFGHKKALAGIVLGAIGTIALIGILVTTLNRGDPLRRRITVDGASSFSLLALDRADQIEAQARAQEERFGPGANEDVNPVYARLSQVRSLVEELDAITDEESLNVVRESIVSQLDSARLDLRSR